MMEEMAPASSVRKQQCPVLSGGDTLIVQRPCFLVEGTLPGKLEALAVVIILSIT